MHGLALCAVGNLVPATRAVGHHGRFGALAETSEALTAARQREEGVVRVVAIAGAVGGLLVQALPAFALTYPDISVHVHESAPEQWGLQLARGEVDLALVRQPAAVPAGFEFRPVGR